MTAQEPDRVIYQGQDYSLIGFQGDGLVDPHQFGLKPVAFTTACWRGFVCTYRIDERLLLQQMEVHIEEEEAPAINGVISRTVPPDLSYENLDMPVEFTGRLRLASDLIGAHYVHMGFQKASAYRTVLDMTFESGRLTEMEDRSAELEAIRGQFKEGYHEMDIVRRIDEAFSMDMDLR